MHFVLYEHFVLYKHFVLLQHFCLVSCLYCSILFCITYHYVLYLQCSLVYYLYSILYCTVSVYYLYNIIICLVYCRITILPISKRHYALLGYMPCFVVYTLFHLIIYHWICPVFWERRSGLAVSLFFIIIRFVSIIIVGNCEGCAYNLTIMIIFKFLSSIGNTIINSNSNKILSHLSF